MRELPAGVVDQDIQRPEFGCDAPEHRGDLFRFADIGFNRQHARPFAVGEFGDTRDLVQCAAADRNAGAEPGEEQGDGPPEAAAAT